MSRGDLIAFIYVLLIENHGGYRRNVYLGLNHFCSEHYREIIHKMSGTVDSKNVHISFNSMFVLNDQTGIIYCKMIRIMD